MCVLNFCLEVHYLPRPLNLCVGYKNCKSLRSCSLCRVYIDRLVDCCPDKCFELARAWRSDHRERKKLWSLKHFSYQRFELYDDTANSARTCILFSSSSALAS